MNVFDMTKEDFEKVPERGELPSRIEPKGWRIDCLPCGYLRVFSQSTLTAGPTLSSLEIYAK